jgi:two-component system response regulator AlgR
MSPQDVALCVKPGKTALKVFLVDDEAPARSRLRNLLEDIDVEIPNEIIGEACNGVEALEKIGDGLSIEAILIDIRMPVMDGIELARHIARLPNPPAVIFVTAYEEYAIRAFELAAVDYLLKPMKAPRLAEALRRARPLEPESVILNALSLPGGRRFIRCPERDRILMVAVADILYFKSELKYITARTLEREYLFEESLSRLEDEFSDRFLRIHRNCIVAREAITGCLREYSDGAAADSDAHWKITLRGIPEHLDVSRRQWPSVRAAIGA